jgi:iron only hydrogenase large subunit-like protein
VDINDDLCIGCGSCITACTHDARRVVDDTEAFFADLAVAAKKGGHSGYIAIVAPSIVSNFPDTFLKVNTYLKNMGVEAIFDVSFGAELTVMAYLDYIEKNKAEFCISQACPAIVTFIEIYHPKLLPYLCGADSPMLCLMKAIKEFFPQYKDKKIAILSPCIAKKREYIETGFGDYNVTFLGFEQYLKAHNVNLDPLQDTYYDNPPPERAVQFSMPGGLLTTAERHRPGIARVVRKIEGVEEIYPYLEHTDKNIEEGALKEHWLPMLVDCLNCNKGCNAGPGTGKQDWPRDKLEAPLWRRRTELEAFYAQNPHGLHIGEMNDKLKKFLEKPLEAATSKELSKKSGQHFQKTLKKYWKDGLYIRRFQNLSENFHLKVPNNDELKAVYESMRKFSEKDMYDCNTCGYGTCKGMALAIFNGLNKPENCHHYNIELVAIEREQLKKRDEELSSHVKKAVSFIQTINSTIGELSGQVTEQAGVVEQSSDSVTEMMTAINDASMVSQKKRDSITALVNAAGAGQKAMQETISAVQSFAKDVDEIGSMTKVISTIAANTNLLSMTAAIEAAHAGDAGQGFAVVAGEIRRLSESTSENSKNISRTLKTIVEGIHATTASSTQTDQMINAMTGEINGFADTMTNLIETLGKLSTQSSEITEVLRKLKEMTANFKASYSGVMDKTKALEQAMSELVHV